MIEKPSSGVLWSWMCLTWIAAAPLTAIGGWWLSLYRPDCMLPATVGWCLCLFVFLFFYLPRRRRSLSFAIETDRVWVSGGVFFITTRSMAIDAVRQVTLLQGPLERLCHTAFLLVSSTGGYLLVEGLELERAEEWRRRLIPV